MTDKENSACNALEAMRFSAPHSDGRSGMAGARSAPLGGAGAPRGDWEACADPVGALTGALPRPRSRSPGGEPSPEDAWAGSGSPGDGGSGGSGGGRSSSHVRMRLHALLEGL